MRLVRRTHIWLAYDFKQRRARTIKIYERMVFFMKELSCVLFQVHPGYIYYFFFSIYRYREVAVMRQWISKLGDLICLWQVWIKIIFPVKPYLWRDLAVQRDRDLCCQVQCIAVQDRQRPWESQAHRADLRIRRCPKIRRAPAEDLALCLQL